MFLSALLRQRKLRRAPDDRSRAELRATNWARSRPGRKYRAIAATLAIAGAALAPHPASSCGYHSASDLALGLMNWSYPQSLHVRTAVWQAENAGVLPPRSASAAKDLFAFNRVVRSLVSLGARLNAAWFGDGGMASFSVVLLDSMMWTNFVAGTGGYRVLTHVSGPAENDVVVVTDSKVIAALLVSQLDGSLAQSLGLIRFYGAPERVGLVRRLFESAGARRSADGATPPQLADREE